MPLNCLRPDNKHKATNCDLCDVCKRCMNLNCIAIEIHPQGSNNSAKTSQARKQRLINMAANGTNKVSRGQPRNQSVHASLNEDTLASGVTAIIDDVESIVEPAGHALCDVIVESMLEAREALPERLRKRVSPFTETCLTDHKRCFGDGVNMLSKFIKALGEALSGGENETFDILMHRALDHPSRCSDDDNIGCANSLAEAFLVAKNPFDQRRTLLL
jgi:hypothetical protein